MDKITSAQNQHVKRWKKLATKKERQKTGTYLIEGWHLFNEANKASINFVSIITTKDQLAKHDDILTLNAAIYEVSPEVMQAISETVTPQGIIAEITIPNDTSTVLSHFSGPWLLLDEVQDPGNIGTMIRTADAAGYEGVVASPHAADFFSPKVVRSMQGSQFHLQLRQGNLHEWISTLKRQQLPVYGSELNPSAKSYLSITPGNKFGLIMGNEGNGMHEDILQQTDANLFIPMAGQAESLNVAVAAGILMFHLHAIDS